MYVADIRATTGQFAVTARSLTLVMDGIARELSALGIRRDELHLEQTGPAAWNVLHEGIIGTVVVAAEPAHDEPDLCVIVQRAAIFWNVWVPGANGNTFEDAYPVGDDGATPRSGILADVFARMNHGEPCAVMIVDENTKIAPDGWPEDYNA